jgi:hypothetical protein
MLIIFTLIAIAGAVYVARGHALAANCIWSISNLGFIYHNIMINEYEMMLLFIVYEIISVAGVFNLTYCKYLDEIERNNL